MRYSIWRSRNASRQAHRQTPINIRALTPVLLGAALFTDGCTGQLPSSFRFRQAEELFNSTDFVNTKLDMLWVIDNSGSMNVSQGRIRDGFTSFAAKYMKPTWDIRVAVITTDTYIANSAFTNYWNSYLVNPGSNFRSSYLRGITQNGIPGRSTSFVNPSWAPNLFVMDPLNANYGKTSNGIRVKDDRPLYGSDWAKLLPGNHDGPMLTMCHEQEGSYISTNGVHRCYIRDDQTGNTGPSHCAAPSGAETSETQCVNTSMNNTVHSGKSIISTIPPSGTPADTAWSNQLVEDFLVNLSPGTTGSGLERAFGSITQLLSDNEGSGSSTKFFRADALRVIVLVGDEDDQTMTLPANPGSNFSPSSDYVGSCTKLIDGVSFNIPTCPDPNKLIAVSTIKNQIDTFFRNLDGSGASADPNYFVVSIVAPTAQVVQTLRTERGTGEIDRADRFIEFGNQVRNGSLVMDISSADYSSALDAVGAAIVSKKAIFTLSRAPTSEEDMQVWVIHSDGSRTLIDPSIYTVDGQTLTITDQAFVLSLASTDRILVNYQPRSAA